MSGPALERDPRYGWAWNANDAFKAGSDARLGWATLVAAALHALLFLWSPSWQPDSPGGGAFAGAEGTEILYLVHTGPEAAYGGRIQPALAVVAEGDGDPTDEDVGGHPDGGGLAPEGSGSPEGRISALRGELVRRSALPTVVEEVVTEAEDEEAPPSPTPGEGAGGEGEGTRIGGRASLADYESLTQDELLALERLSALRPELAFMSPSSWILLRNPADVESFFLRRVHEPQLAANASRSVSVAVWIDDRGSVEWAEIKQSSGSPEVDESVLELFRNVASFRPAREGGVHVPVAIIFWLSFPW